MPTARWVASEIRSCTRAAASRARPERGGRDHALERRLAHVTDGAASAPVEERERVLVLQAERGPVH